MCELFSIVLRLLDKKAKKQSSWPNEGDLDQTTNLASRIVFDSSFSTAKLRS